MPPRLLKKGKAPPPIALGSSLVRENLPARLVYYPNHNGIFFAFATSRDEPPALCACAEGAVRNLFRLAEPAAGPDDARRGRLPPLDFGFFPDPIATALAQQQADPLAALRFSPGLCHRCNLEAPTLRYCHEKDGQRFVQTYGWYMNQTYLRLGIHPSTHTYLPDVCPPQYHDVLGRIAALTTQAREIRARLVALMNGPRREIARGERSHWPNVTAAEAAPLEAIDWQLNKPRVIPRQDEPAAPADRLRQGQRGEVDRVVKPL